MATELKPCPFCGGEAIARPNLPTYDGNNIDLDIRFGCIAYGIELTQPPKGEQRCE